ncbi:uncharacterized protein LOC117588509 [Drosophila guanche]|uniref:Protein TsetseEP domain-containing protein n=1 Tax=Drosophila guanche TaxID=7266 RepID=A0A3B0JZX9_DROGU|nr:uncharacterized protein LOC117588509 [Drosophila guanche]SPP86633.1 Hypothetical predicted protein [Drosophila guanche]
MKSIVAVVLALCVASAFAQPLAIPSQLDAQVRSVVDEITEIGKNTGEALVHQYEEIVLEPQHELEEAVEQVEARRTESPECVAAEDEQIARILDVAHEELHSCGVVAAHTSAEIATDVSAATQQLTFGGYNLVRTYNKCNSYNSNILKQSCMAKFYVQASIFLISANSSIKTIKKSTNERIPAVFAESSVCTHDASAQAVLGLEEVNRHIDACASRR